MKKILTFGVFDYFHYGHLRMLERCKALGDYLVVAVQDGDYILKYKPDAEILCTTEQRVAMIEALKCVDEVYIYKDVDKDIQKIDFDTWVLGGDQGHAGFVRAQEWCEANGKEVTRLERTPNISSTMIRGKLKEKNDK